MAIPLTYQFENFGDADRRIDIPRAATAYLAASWQPGGTPTPTGEGRRVLVIPGELVIRIRARDPAAFETFVHLVYPQLVQFARGFVGSRETAEDVVQDVLATVWERASQWAPTGNPATYLFGMVRHRAIDLLRQRTSSTRRHLRIVEDDEGAHTESPEQRLIDAEESLRAAARLRILEELLTSMSERQRTAYDLRYRQGLSVAELAHVLGITPKSGEQLLGRTMRAIRERMRMLEAEIE